MESSRDRLIHSCRRGRKRRQIPKTGGRLDVFSQRLLPCPVPHSEQFFLLLLFPLDFESPPRTSLPLKHALPKHFARLRPQPLRPWMVPIVRCLGKILVHAFECFQAEKLDPHFPLSRSDRMLLLHLPRLRVHVNHFPGAMVRPDVDEPFQQPAVTMLTLKSNKTSFITTKVRSQPMHANHATEGHFCTKIHIGSSILQPFASYFTELTCISLLTVCVREGPAVGYR